MRIGIASLQLGERLRQALQQPGYDVAWMVLNGSDAILKCKADPPELALLDPNIPGMNSVEVTRRIMRDSPCPILLVTDSVDGNAAKIFDALGAGAIDAVNFIGGGSAEQQEKNRAALLKKIKTVMRLHAGAPEFDRNYSAAKPIALPKIVPPLIVIGSSAGGPRTLAAILGGLPAKFSGVITIVQHVNQEFSVSLAEWLGTQTPLNVRIAINGESPRAGNVYVAGTNDHLILTNNLTFTYTSEPQDMPYRPSVDVFFKSVARHWPEKGHAILLTGMGRDGAEGLAVLRRAGWHTIAQDESTSVVYGMPKAAKEIGAAVEILPTEQILATILKKIKLF